MKKRKNSFLAWLLAAVLAIGMLPASALPSFADEPVNVSTGAELKAALEDPGDKTGGFPPSSITPFFSR